MQQHSDISTFNNSDSWVILSTIEQSIKHKIESVGTLLKDWDINIYRGVLTGYNEAFIISTEKRNEILSNCKTEEEKNRTAELIRPILRGRDIKRYGYDWANLWLINTHNGVKGKFPRININEYPALKQHLDKYWDKIEKRADQGDTPYNLRNCAYLEDF
ncbi:MAG: restriction endonuclease, partial [Bacteroidales bacterium]|nr:restriction endonuclease [Bacteroidales bacterium]